MVSKRLVATFIQHGLVAMHPEKHSLLSPFPAFTAKRYCEVVTRGSKRNSAFWVAEAGPSPPKIENPSVHLIPRTLAAPQHAFICAKMQQLF